MDTAPGLLRRGPRLAELLREDPSFFVATKIWDTEPESVEAVFARQLAGYARPSIDLLQVHGLNGWQADPSWLDRQKAAGRVRFTGVALPVQRRLRRCTDLVGPCSLADDLCQADSQPQLGEREGPTVSGKHDETGFRFGWRGSHHPGMPVDDLWLAVGMDPDGTWCFDAYFIGRTTLSGGAPLAAAFARWLLASPPEGRYEKEFMLVDGEPQSGSRRLTNGTQLTVEILLGREEAGGPEYLQVLLSGEIRNLAFEVCAPLECQRVLRAELEAAAARLLTSCA